MSILHKNIKKIRPAVCFSVMALFGLFETDLHGATLEINTIAGTGTYDGMVSGNFSAAAFTQTGTSALSTSLGKPMGVVWDNSDSSRPRIVFIDHDHSAIRSIDETGTITTILSHLNRGSSVGNNVPQYLAIDPTTGNLFSADGEHIFSITKDNTFGHYIAVSIILSTAANASSLGWQGALNGNPIGSFALSTGSATFSYGSYSNPLSVAYAPADISSSTPPYLYVGYNNHIVRHTLDISNNFTSSANDVHIISNLHTNSPLTLSPDSSTLYFIDTPGGLGCTVKSLSLSSGSLASAPYTTPSTLTTIAGFNNNSGAGFTTTNPTLNSASHIQVDRNGNVYIADTGNHVIRYVCADGADNWGLSSPTVGNVYTIVGGGSSNYSHNRISPTLASLSSPTGLFVDAYANGILLTEGNSGNPYNFIRRVAIPGLLTTDASSNTLANDVSIPYYTGGILSGGSLIKIDNSNYSSIYGKVGVVGSGTTLEIKHVDSLGSGFSSTNSLFLDTGTTLKTGSEFNLSNNVAPSVIPVPISYKGIVTIDTSDSASAAHYVETQKAITCAAATGINQINVKGGGIYQPGAAYTASGGTDTMVVTGGTTLKLGSSNYIPSNLTIGSGSILDLTFSGTVSTALTFQ